MTWIELPSVPGTEAAGGSERVECQAGGFTEKPPRWKALPSALSARRASTRYGAATVYPIRWNVAAALEAAPLA